MPNAKGLLNLLEENEEVNYLNYNYDREVVVTKSGLADGKPIALRVTLKRMDGTPDAIVGHFRYKFHYRTIKGIMGEKYASRRQLESDINRLLKANGFKIIHWVDSSTYV